MKTANQNLTYQKSTASHTLAKSAPIAQIPLAKLAFVFCIMCIVCIFSACSSKPKYVKNTKDYTSFGLDSHDIKKAIEDSANSLINSDFAKTLEGKKVIAISDIENKTDEEIDIEYLSRNLARKLRNSKKFVLTNAIAGSGSSTDKMIKNSRGLRDDEEYNQYTVQEKGSLIAPDFSLSGKINKTQKEVDKNLVVEYQLLLTLTGLKNGIVFWDDEKQIAKVINKDQAYKYTKNANPNLFSKDKYEDDDTKRTSAFLSVGLGGINPVNLTAIEKYGEHTIADDIQLALNLRLGAEIRILKTNITPFISPFVSLGNYTLFKPNNLVAKKESGNVDLFTIGGGAYVGIKLYGASIYGLVDYGYSPFKASNGIKMPIKDNLSYGVGVSYLLGNNASGIIIGLEYIFHNFTYAGGTINNVNNTDLQNIATPKGVLQLDSTKHKANTSAFMFNIGLML